MRIFLLEDNRPIRQKIAKVFQSQGCIVVSEAGNTSEDSLQKALNSKADLFILDIQLEHKKSGFEFAKKLYEFDKNIQLIYLSDRDEYYDESFNLKNYPIPLDFISKNNLELIGWDKGIQQFITRFKAHQPSKVRIAGQTVLVNDIMFVEIKDKQLLDVFMKDGKVLEKYANLKDLINPNSEDYISNLVPAQKDLLVHEKQITKCVRENKKEEPATLFFHTTNGKEYTRKTSQKRGAAFHKRHG